MDSLSLVFKLSSAIVSIYTKEHPLEKVVQGHIDSAVNACRNIEKEKNYHAVFNRVISDLSAAYYIHVRSIKTWKWGDYRKKSLYGQHKESNRICLFIACIYYLLDNQDMVDDWLLNKMGIGPYEDLGVELFSYEQLLGDKYDEFKRKIAEPSDAIELLIDQYDRAAEDHMDSDHIFGGPGF
ncbi:MAG: hypothetical protein IJK46_07915 [Prevotella sp.]|nr:hypothetical protein [Prevotella sp.]